MVKSEFKFTNPKLIDLSFQINKDYINEQGQDLTAELSIAPNIFKINQSEADVELNIKVGELSNSCPFFINLTVCARFKIDSEDKELDFDRFLKVNAPALLVSYARPIIAFITNQAGMFPFNLPFINFTV